MLSFMDAPIVHLILHTTMQLAFSAKVVFICFLIQLMLLFKIYNSLLAFMIVQLLTLVTLITHIMESAKVVDLNVKNAIQWKVAYNASLQLMDTILILASPLLFQLQTSRFANVIFLKLFIECTNYKICQSCTNSLESTCSSCYSSYLTTVCSTSTTFTVTSSSYV